MISCSFKRGGLLKPANYVFINTWNTEIYTPLSLIPKNHDWRYGIKIRLLLLWIEAVDN